MPARARLMKENGVEVRYYSIIYEAIDDVKARISGMLAPEIKEQIVGLAEVREVFRSQKFGVVAGCLVIEGVVRRNNPIRVLRDNVVIFEGELESLRRFKDDVSEVRAGTECGIGVKNYKDVQVGRPDRVFERVEIARRSRTPHGSRAMRTRPAPKLRRTETTMPREFSRSRRVGDQIQRELAVLCSSEFRIRGLGLISISGVEVSRDLAHAKSLYLRAGDNEAARRGACGY